MKEKDKEIYNKTINEIYDDLIKIFEIMVGITYKLTLLEEKLKKEKDDDYMIHFD